MEEIDFRAWDKKEKRMLYGFNCIHFGNNKVSGIFDITNEDKVFEYHKEIELMQSTGVLDKKGKEIFEGDILIIKTWLNFIKTKAIVTFERGSFLADGASVSNWLDTEIIGNKFENPEMAKEFEDG
jgi:uncharacterized phage protein (TIGR01671 family)